MKKQKIKNMFYVYYITPGCSTGCSIIKARTAKNAVKKFYKIKYRREGYIIKQIKQAEVDIIVEEHYEKESI